MQLNINGLGDKHHILHQIINKHKIDMLLIQEWSAKLRFNVPIQTQSQSQDALFLNKLDENKRTRLFPIHLFNAYNVFYQDTNLAIMYKKYLDIEPVYNIK